MTVGRSSDYPNQIPKLWSTELYSQAEDLTFWNKFEGPEGSSMPIIRKDEMVDRNVDTIKYDIVLSLTSTGSQTDSATDSTFSTQATLTEGREARVVFSQAQLRLASIRHAVRWNWLVDQLIDHDMRSAALGQLKKWLAGKIDDRVFAELVGAGTTTMPAIGRLGQTAASTVNQNCTDVTYVEADTALDLDGITKAKAYAVSSLRMEPLRLNDGVEVFGLVIHPYVEAALKVSSDYKQAQRDANVRGESNPLFSGASAIWDGVIIYVSNRVPLATTTNVRKNIFFGAQAMCRGYGMYPSWVEQDFSYGEESGIATRVVLGEKLNVFDLSQAQDGSANTPIGAAVLASLAAPSVT